MKMVQCKSMPYVVGGGIMAKQMTLMLLFGKCITVYAATTAY